MLANQRGLVGCLLNRWHEESSSGHPFRSRGRLVMEVAALVMVDLCSTPAAMLKRYMGKAACRSFVAE